MLDKEKHNKTLENACVLALIRKPDQKKETKKRRSLRSDFKDVWDSAASDPQAGMTA